MSIIIEFKNVTKQYKLFYHLNGGIKNFIVNFGKNVLAHDSFIALNHINLIIRAGETIGIVGRNGSGKSTILGLIAGIEKPTEGSITTKGRIVSMLELGGGFHPDLTGRENILLNSVLLGLTLQQAKERINLIIEYSELGDFIDEPIRIYSSGMLARLGFSIMTQMDPDILIVDEVLAVGDYAFQEKCMQTMKAFKGNGVTIILVSHSAKDIQCICERVIWIDNHKIKMDDTMENVMKIYGGIEK
jgi:lipopolysaccharide transport system ATP-binding protein